MAILDLSDARYITDRPSGYRLVGVRINGRDVFYSPEDLRPIIAATGHIFCGEHAAPETIEVPHPTEPGKTLALTGFSNDPRLIALVEKYLQDLECGDWREGPVPIPTLEDLKPRNPLTDVVNQHLGAKLPG